MNNVSDYFDTVSDEHNALLCHVRQIILTQLPDAKEVITYGMPGVKINGKYVIAYGAFKNHCSIFPGVEPIALLKNQLKEYRCSKGAIQFTTNKPLSDSLLIEIIKLCEARAKHNLSAT